jgi:branched-chain amino acid transport system ATP-binding protein
VLLQVEGLSARYGAVPVLHQVDLDVDAGEAVALLGANGAGKTTTLRAVSGLVRPSAGTVRLGGRVLSGRPPHEAVAAGVGHVPEGRRLFARMTVAENLAMGAYARRRPDPADLARVHALFPVLQERAAQLAGTLSGGEQQMVALGRALMGRPRLLLLDEPALGRAPQVVETVLAAVTSLVADGTAVLLVEQDVGLALGVASRAHVLATGRVVLSGRSEDLRDDPRLAAAYLGG